MPKKINVKGVIISSNEKWIYDLFEIENTTVNDVLNELPSDDSPIEVVINSGGGDVYAGSEIYTILKDYAGDVTTKIVGVAASAASVVAMAGKQVLMSPTAQMMIHNVSGGNWGDYRSHEHEAEVLKNYNVSISNAYRLKSGKSQEELLEMMNKETWFNAQQALEHKLIDEIMFQNGAPSLVASIGPGMIPQNVVDKIRSMKNQFIQGPTEPTNTNDEKQKLLLEIELI